jgi:hypothetical protein
LTLTETAPVLGVVGGAVGDPPHVAATIVRNAMEASRNARLKRTEVVTDRPSVAF